MHSLSHIGAKKLSTSYKKVLALQSQNRFEDALNEFVTLLPNKRERVTFQPEETSTGKRIVSKSEVDYYLGYLCIYSGDFELAEKHFSSMPVHIGVDAENLPYLEFVRRANESWNQMEQSKTGRQSVFLTAMPKSASSFVSQILSMLIRCPVVRCCVGPSPKNVLIEKWVENLKTHVAVTHCHLLADANNTAILARAWGEKALFVQIRPPVESGWSSIASNPSFLYKNDKSFGITDPTAHVFLQAISHAMLFQKSWSELSQDAALNLQFIEYQNISQTAAESIDLIAKKSGNALSYSDINEMVLKSEKKEGHLNFRKGDQDEWRQNLEPDLVEYIDTIVC